MMRSVAIIRNSIWGTAQQMTICILSIFSRRVMLETVGQLGVGLNDLLSSVISLLSLAELGVGTAIVYRMYEPIAKGDRVQIVKLMHCYKLVYRMIACVIFALGLCLLPFMGGIVRDVPYSPSYVSAIFLLFLIHTTSSYFFTYKRSMLSADQKQYIITIFDLVYRLVTILAGIAVLKVTGELACYLLLLIVSTVIDNLLLSLYVDRLYPYLRQGGSRLPWEEVRQIFRDVKNIFVEKLSTVLVNSTDSILINAFVGTVQTGLFSNYNIIIHTLSGVTNQISAGMRGSVGNLIAVEGVGPVEAALKKLTFMMFLIASFCAGCLAGLMDRFVALAFGAGLEIGGGVVSLMIFGLFLSTVSIPIKCMTSAAGLFVWDKWISLIGSAVNLILSLLLGWWLGMVGILAGTCAAYLLHLCLRIAVFYTRFLKKGCRAMLGWIGAFTLTAAAECAAVAWCCQGIDIVNDVVSFVICGVVAALLPSGLNVIFFHRTAVFQGVLNTIKDVLMRYRTAG